MPKKKDHVFKMPTIKQVDRSEVQAPRATRSLVSLLVKDIHAQLKDAPEQRAVEISNISQWAAQRVKKELNNDFNFSYSSTKQTMWVWRGL